MSRKVKPLYALVEEEEAPKPNLVIEILKGLAVGFTVGLILLALFILALKHGVN